MKMKKLISALLAAAVSISLCFTASASDDFDHDAAIARVEAERAELLSDPSPWADAKWLQLTDRIGDHSGIDIILTIMLEEVEEKYGRSEEGYYRFSWVVDTRHSLLGGAKLKILTWGDETPDFKRVRFTGYDRLDGLTAQITYFNDRLEGDNQPTSGMIPASFIVEAAEHDHAMRFQTHDGDDADFHVWEIIVEHFPDGEDGESVEVYRLSKDPILQEMQIGERFESGSTGFMISGNASFLIIDKDNLDPPLYVPPEEGEASENGSENDTENASESDSENPADENNGAAPEDTPPGNGGVTITTAATGNSGEDETPIVLILAIAGGAVLLIVIIAVAAASKRKK